MSPSSGVGEPLAMCTMPSTPKSSATQPITWRPAGPLRSGSRRLRQATKQSSSGTNHASRPTEPATTVRVNSPMPPGSCHHTAAATTRARPTRNSPAPSRRCSGSSSRAVWPIRRTPPPTAWATPSQAVTSTRARAVKTRAIGPGPLRTARGAGRRPVELPRLRAAARLGAGFRPDLFPVDREREAEPPCPDLRAGVLLLRDPGGEDVRVAMLANLPRTPHPSLASHAAQESCRAGQPARPIAIAVGDSSSDDVDRSLVVGRRLDHGVAVLGVAQRQPEPEGAARRPARRRR